MGLGRNASCIMNLTFEHQECNIATNWLSVDDENEEGFPLWPAALICLGRAFVVPRVLFKSKSTVNCREIVLLLPRKSMVYSYVLIPSWYAVHYQENLAR